MKIVTDLYKLSLPTTNVEYDGNMPNGVVRMIMYLKVNKKTAVGISANQLGMDMRVCCFWDGGVIRTLINPYLEAISVKDVTMEEMCLSLPNKKYEVTRHTAIKVTSANYPLPQTYGGFMARVVQHEIDHLDGITIKDRAEDDYQSYADMTSPKESV